MSEQLFRALSQHSAHLATFAFDAWDLHRVVGCGLVTHPCDDRGFGSFLNGNAFRSCDGSAANGCGVLGDGDGELLFKRSVLGVEVEKADN